MSNCAWALLVAVILVPVRHVLARPASASETAGRGAPGNSDHGPSTCSRIAGHSWSRRKYWSQLVLGGFSPGIRRCVLNVGKHAGNPVPQAGSIGSVCVHQSRMTWKRQPGLDPFADGRRLTRVHRAVTVAAHKAPDLPIVGDQEAPREEVSQIPISARVADDSAPSVSRVQRKPSSTLSST